MKKITLLLIMAIALLACEKHEIEIEQSIDPDKLLMEHHAKTVMAGKKSVGDMQRGETTYMPNPLPSYLSSCSYNSANYAGSGTGSAKADYAMLVQIETEDIEDCSRGKVMFYAKGADTLTLHLTVWNDTESAASRRSYHEFTSSNWEYVDWDYLADVEYFINYHGDWDWSDDFDVYVSAHKTTDASVFVSCLIDDFRYWWYWEPSSFSGDSWDYCTEEDLDWFETYTLTGGAGGWDEWDWQAKTTGAYVNGSSSSSSCEFGFEDFGAFELACYAKRDNCPTWPLKTRKTFTLFEE